MIKNKNGETIVSVIIVVVIISIVTISMIKIVEYDNNLNFEQDKINYISLLEKNTNIMVNKIDTSNLLENEVFFINKNWTKIEVFSWVENQEYKYINYLWENVNSWSYLWAIYTRQCIIEKDSPEWQMIKCSIKELIRK